MSKASSQAREFAEALAIQALNFLATDPEQLARFLAGSGIGPDSIRAAAAEPEFLAGVLAFLGENEALLVAFAAAAGVKPGAVDRARTALSGHDWEREVP
jgi:uncharacterized protein DUF3572